MAAQIGQPLAERLRDLTLAIYPQASAYAAARGIIIADTKFEFGYHRRPTYPGRRSPHSRLLPLLARRQYQPGGPQPSYDKQFVRDYLESIHWNKQPPAPALPPDVIAKTNDNIRKPTALLPGNHELGRLPARHRRLASIVSGFIAGFARVGIGTAATFIGIFAGFWCYGLAGAYVLDYVSSRPIANLIGFFIVFLSIVLLGAMFGRLVAALFKWIGLSWFDRFWAPPSERCAASWSPSPS